MAALLQPIFIAIDGNGDPMAGAKLYFYTTGTSTLQATYTNSGLTIAHANPVLADSAGLFPPIYLGTTNYKLILKTSADVTVQTIDPVLVPANTIVSTEGDLIVANSSGVAVRLPIGVANRFLKSSGTSPSWEQVNLATTDVTGVLPKNRGGTGTSLATPVVATLVTYVFDAAAIIPYDDTIPQVTEGRQLFSQAFTASTATNRVRVTVSASLGVGADNGCVALFVDGAANAVACKFFYLPGDAPCDVGFLYEAAQTAGAHTYLVRAGTASLGLGINGNSTARKGGGTNLTILTIEEIPAP